jgi:hypothetical protein
MFLTNFCYQFISLPCVLRTSPILFLDLITLTISCESYSICFWLCNLLQWEDTFFWYHVTDFDRAGWHSITRNVHKSHETHRRGASSEFLTSCWTERPVRTCLRDKLMMSHQVAWELHASSAPPTDVRRTRRSDHQQFGYRSGTRPSLQLVCFASL